VIDSSIILGSSVGHIELFIVICAGLVNMKKLYEHDYCDTLPPEEQEMLMEYAASETLC